MTMTVTGIHFMMMKPIMQIRGTVARDSNSIQADSNAASPKRIFFGNFMINKCEPFAFINQRLKYIFTELERVSVIE